MEFRLRFGLWGAVSWKWPRVALHGPTVALTIFCRRERNGGCVDIFVYGDCGDCHCHFLVLGAGVVEVVDDKVLLGSVEL